MDSAETDPLSSYSPRVSGRIASPPPSPLSVAERSAVLRLLTGRRPRPRTLVIGSSRDEASRTTAAVLAVEWESSGGTVLDVVNWPEDAASWLRQARRFAAGPPDVWAVTGRPAGWVQMGRRLGLSTDWDPSRTVATSSLADDVLIARGGIGTFDGLRGAYRDGGTWEICRTLRIDHP